MQQLSSSNNDSIRNIEPQNTLRQLQGIFSKIGITRVANVTHLDKFYGIFVSNCIRPNSQNLSVAQGKGSTLELSHISAIMESIEAYHVENPLPPVFKTSFETQGHSKLIDPYHLYLTEYRTDLNKLEFNWTAVENILDKQQFFIPSSITRINTCFPNPDYLYFNVSSNGLAAGNSKEEAIFHGICEIIERDSLIKWQNTSIEFKQTVSLILETIDDFNQEFIDNIRSHGLSLQIWEITSELGIPTYHAALTDTHDLRDLNVFTGTGAHLSKSIALFRAISECIQARLTYITGMRDDIFENYYKHMRLNANNLSSKSLQTDNAKNYQDSISLSVGKVNDNLETVINILLKHNYQQILMLDHTKPELSIPVLQIFIPGMQLNNSRM